jgi:XRE family transcriptional regulator, fatty acid utilization regulator
MRRTNSHKLKLGRRLRAVRHHFKLTQKEVGDAIGVTAAQVSYLEHGRSEPSFAQLVVLANRYGIRIEELLSWPIRS